MGRDLILYPSQGIKLNSKGELKGTSFGITRLGASREAEFIGQLGAYAFDQEEDDEDIMKNKIPIKNVPESVHLCFDDGVKETNRHGLPFRYMLAEDIKKIDTTIVKDEWNIAIISFINSLPPKTVVILDDC